jgi:hypothetical protein
VECSQIGVAPAVDRLLRVTDHEQHRALGGGALERQLLEQGALERIGILELVHQQLVDTPAHARGQGGVELDQAAGVAQEGRVGLDALRAQLGLHLGEEGAQHRAQLHQQLRLELQQRSDEGVSPRGGRRRVAPTRSELALLGGTEATAGPLLQALQILGVAPDVTQPVAQCLELRHAARGLGQAPGGAAHARRRALGAAASLPA